MRSMKVCRAAAAILFLVAGAGCSEASSVAVSEIDAADSRQAIPDSDRVSDPKGPGDLEACLDYPDSYSVSRKDVFELLEQDGWATVTPRSLMTELAAIDLLPDNALVHAALLDPANIEGLVALSGPLEGSPIQAYVAARIRRSWHEFESAYVHFAGPGPWSGIVAIGVSADGAATFLMDCGKWYSRDIRYIASQSPNYDSEDDVIRALIVGDDGMSARAILADRDVGVQWSDLNPDERSLDSELVPDDIARAVEPRRIWFDIPPSWADLQGTLCAKLDVGWSSCIDLSAARYGPLGVDVMPNLPLQLFVMDSGTSLDGPRHLVGLVLPDMLQRAASDSLEVVLTAKQEVPSLEHLLDNPAASPEESPMFEVRLESLDVVEGWLPRLEGTVVSGED